MARIKYYNSVTGAWEYADGPGGCQPVRSDAMPAYWTDYLEGKLQSIRDKIVEGGANTDCFMYFTDHHIGCMNNLDNANNTRHIIDYVRKHTPIQNVFFGGDILNTTAAQTHEHVMNWLWKFHDDYISDRGVHPVIGNHEISTQYDTSGNHITYDEAYSILFRDVEKTTDTGKKLYYFVDNPSQKIRYIVLDTESEAISGNKEQLQWFIHALESLESGWTAVLFAHHFSDATAYDNPTNPIITQIAGDYNHRVSGSSDAAAWDFTFAKGVAACLICGHIHLDGSGVNNGIHVIHVTTDCGANADNAANDNDAGGNRTAGDISEQAVDLFFINTKEHTIDTIRLGFGEDRSWTYEVEPTVVDIMENAEVIIGAPGSVLSDGTLNYYYENNQPQATLNPMMFYADAGSTLHVSLSDYSTYRYIVYMYSCDESAKDADFSVTEGTSKRFGVTGERVYNHNDVWFAEDAALEIEEPRLIALMFKNTGYTTLSAEDTAAIKGLLSITVTP